MKDDKKFNSGLDRVASRGNGVFWQKGKVGKGTWGSRRDRARWRYGEPMLRRWSIITSPSTKWNDCDLSYICRSTYHIQFSLQSSLVSVWVCKISSDIEYPRLILIDRSVGDVSKATSDRHLEFIYKRNSITFINRWFFFPFFFLYEFKTDHWIRSRV